ncbi:MAG TPA: 50S ribosomal protein L25/general stress protein Ctc, partial [Micropepsaceae bacterium]|nr:50S ribosomal protein L25/general stress protein Ctc [Micropepsaceae bacterium]
MAQARPLNVTAREGSGSGAARKVRDALMVPGVIYGGKDAPQNVAMSVRDLDAAIQAGRFTSTLFEVNVAGKKSKVVPRDVQVHPVTDRPVHFDLFRIEEGSRVALYIPVRFINQETSPGLKRGGVLNVVRHEVELYCPSDNIPQEIIADLGTLDINDSLHISAFKLPEGVKPVIQSRDFTVATIVPPSTMAETEVKTAEADAAAAPAAGAAP